MTKYRWSKFRLRLPSWIDNLNINFVIINPFHEKLYTKAFKDTVKYKYNITTKITETLNKKMNWLVTLGCSARCMNQLGMDMSLGEKTILSLIFFWNFLRDDVKVTESFGCCCRLTKKTFLLLTYPRPFVQHGGNFVKY